MKWSLPILMVLSFNVSARVTCPDLKTAMNVEDDLCESLSETAEKCFEKLNTEFYKKSANTTELIADYERELKKIRTEFYPKLKSIGQGLSCRDQVGEVEVWMDEMSKDIKVLKKRSKNLSK